MVIFLVQVSGLSIVTFHIFTDKNTSCTVNDFIMPKFNQVYLQIVYNWYYTSDFYNSSNCTSLCNIIWLTQWKAVPTWWNIQTTKVKTWPVLYFSFWLPWQALFWQTFVNVFGTNPTEQSVVQKTKSDPLQKTKHKNCFPNCIIILHQNCRRSSKSNYQR